MSEAGKFESAAERVDMPDAIVIAIADLLFAAGKERMEQDIRNAIVATHGDLPHAETIKQTLNAHIDPNTPELLITNAEVEEIEKIIAQFEQAG